MQKHLFFQLFVFLSIRKLHWRAVMSVFFYFWKLVMWPTSQKPIAWSLAQNHHDPVLHKVFSHSFLSDFLATMCSLPYLAMHTDYVDTTSSLSITVYIMFILFSSDFWLCLHQLPYWAMCTDHVNNASTLSKRVHVMSILFRPIFFWFSHDICIDYHIRKCAQTI